MEQIRPISSRQVFEKLNADPIDGERITVVLGAGASFGYTNANDEFLVPPTVGLLFDEGKNKAVARTLASHPSIKGSLDEITRMTKKFNGDFERFLSSFFGRKKSDGLFAQLLLYFQHLFYIPSEKMDPQNNYRYLIQSMRFLRGPWSCITFNYDTLFERSFMMTGENPIRNFSQLRHYESFEPKILKVHGGVNFRYITREKRHHSLAFEADPVQKFEELMRDEGTEPSISSNIASSPATSIHSRDEQDMNVPTHRIATVDFPYMMVPIHGTNMHSNVYFKRILDVAKTEIENSSLVIAIGYNFGDELFCNKISEIDSENKELIIVGSSDMSKEYESSLWYQNLIKKNGVKWKGKIFLYNGGNFGHFVNAIRELEETENEI